MGKKFYRKGLRFTCTGCGDCCTGRGDYENVYVDLSERKSIAEHLKLSTSVFTRLYTEKAHGFRRLIFASGLCPFLKDKQCSVYRVRPNQCRTWPFWPENMNKKVWEKEVLKLCPGAGNGKLHSSTEISVILEKQ